MKMSLKQRIKKESMALPIMMKGYSRMMANAWARRTQYDMRKNGEVIGKAVLQEWHKKGYLSRSVERYGLLENPNTDYISDFQYMYLSPLNNSFAKWIEDILTTKRVLLPYDKHFREVYFSIIRREKKALILHVGQEDREYTDEDIVQLVREKGVLELRPAFWGSSKRRYKLTIENNYLHLNDEVTGPKAFNRLLNSIKSNYVVADYVPIDFAFRPDLTLDHSLKLWIANDIDDEPRILCAVMNLFWDGEEPEERLSEAALVDLESGAFEFQGETLVIPQWDSIKAEIVQMSATIRQVSFYTTSIALKEDGVFQFLHFSKRPILPQVAFNSELNDYLLNRFNRAFHKRNFSDRMAGLRNRLFEKSVAKRGRKGIRPYMQKQWDEAVRSDFWHTKGVPVKTKLWAYKRGYLSFRTYQYGLTEDNYSTMLSDYDYHWLNRINNDYQKWVNDKTTYRYVMEPFKDYVPKYYFSCFRQNDKAVFAKMWDCPEGIPDGLDGFIEVLKLKGKLAFKASAGTHGDGFYCLSYEDGTYYVNDAETDEAALRELVTSQRSFYIATEYLEMHHELKKIYAKSVNTVRIMVINNHGYDPKIMQTYMRIGSSKTGFTDNIGYGGVTAMIDAETGMTYRAEQLVDHRYQPCPVHPDTGVSIENVYLPNWELVKSTVLAVCQYFCELEYLGFDIAITDDGLRILEINIHQDLHKVAEYNEEIMEFFHRKIADKKRIYKIK